MGFFGALSREAHRDDRNIGSRSPVGAAPDRSQPHILLFRRVMGYRATAKQYCSSSAGVTRHAISLSY
jgi:hypothetical protein